MTGKQSSPGTLDMWIESVDDDGMVVMRMPGGTRFSFHISEELVTSYRRLIPGTVAASAS